MKKQIIIYGLAVAIIASCKTKEPSTTLSACIDVTDRRILQANADRLLEVLDCKTWPAAAYRVRIHIISDKQITPVWDILLPADSGSIAEDVDGDPQARPKMVMQFYGKVRAVMNTAYKLYDTTRALPFTQCWIALATELKVLSEDKADRKHLYVYSDGSEHNRISMYASFSESHFDSIRQELNAIMPLPQNLHGITVKFIYQPMSSQDDSRFAVVYKFYQWLFGQRGAKVELQTTQLQ